MHDLGIYAFGSYKKSGDKFRLIFKNKSTEVEFTCHKMHPFKYTIQ